MKQTNSKAYQTLRVFRLEPSNLDSSVNILARTVKQFYCFPVVCFVHLFQLPSIYVNVGAHITLGAWESSHFWQTDYFILRE